MGDSGDPVASIHKNLIDYYKWVVSLATIILTISISFVGLTSNPLVRPGWLYFGWSLLLVCIMANWLIVKRLVTLPIVEAVPESEKTRLHRLFDATLGNLKVYGLVQNAAFVLGTIATLVGLVSNAV